MANGKAGRPRIEDVQRDGAGKGLREGTRRFSVIARVETMEALRTYCKAQNVSIKDALDEMITKYTK